MAGSRVADRVRRAGKSSTRLAVLGAAAATGAAAVLGSAPPASALDVTQDIYTAGPLLSVLPALGLDSVTISLGNIQPVGDVNLVLDLNPTSGSTVDLYNTVNALPFNRRGLFSSIFDRVLGPPADPTTQFPAVAGSGGAARNLADAYRAQISSVNGNTPPGFTPFEPGTGNNTNATNEFLLYVNDPLRPNGGIGSRFAPILNLFGVDTTVPAAGVNTATGLRLNAATLDLAWAYSPVADLPVTLNPFSWVNSLLAAVPINLLGGLSLAGLDLTTAGINIAGTLGILRRLSVGILPISDGQAWYGTLLPNDLPILEPLRLPSRLLNAAFGLDLGTPIADALQPALTILVNTGYSDVVTPADIAADPSLANTYQPYDRTFLTSGTAETFLSVAPLTPAEWLQVPGDVLGALITGFRDVFFPPAPQAPPASADTPAVTAPGAMAATPADYPADSVPGPELGLPSAPDSTAAAAVAAPGNPVSSPSPAAVTVPAPVGRSGVVLSPTLDGSSAGLASAASAPLSAPRVRAEQRSARTDTGQSTRKRVGARSAAGGA